MMDQQWEQIYRAEFGKRLDGDDVRSFEYSFDYRFPRRGTDEGWTVKELLTAIMSLSEERRSTGKAREFAPTAPQLASRIIKLRMESRAGERAPEQDCALCNSGWITVAPGLREDFCLTEYFEAYRCAIPCRCNAGLQVFEAKFAKVNHDQRETLRTMCRMAIRQHARESELVQAELAALEA